MGVLIGIMVIMLPQFPKKWFLTLFVGFVVLAVSLPVRDKQKYYLFLMVLGLLVVFSKTLLFHPSAIFRSTFGYTVYIWVPPLLMLYFLWGMRGVSDETAAPISTTGLWAFAGVFVTAAISVLGGNRLWGSFGLFELILAGLLFIYVASDFKDTRTLRLTIIFLIIATFIEAAIAIAQNLTGSALGLGVFGARKFITGYVGLLTLTRVTGTFGHPSALAEFFDLTIPLTVSMLFFPMRRSLKILLAVTVLIEFIGQGMSYSRGGITATILFSGLILLVHFCKRLGVARGLFTTFALGVVLSLLVLTIPNPIERGLSRTETVTAYGRIPLMEVAFNMIRAHPWFGVGLNNYVPVALDYDFTPEHYTSSWNTAVHNIYLFIAGEIGIPGLLFFLAMLASVFRAWLPVWRATDPLVFYGGMGVMAGLGAFLLHGMSDFTPWTSEFVFWFMLGLAVSLGNRARNHIAGLETASI